MMPVAPSPEVSPPSRPSLIGSWFVRGSSWVNAPDGFHGERVVLLIKQASQTGSPRASGPPVQYSSRRETRASTSVKRRFYFQMSGHLLPYYQDSKVHAVLSTLSFPALGHPRVHVVVAENNNCIRGTELQTQGIVRMSRRCRRHPEAWMDPRM